MKKALSFIPILFCYLILFADPVSWETVSYWTKPQDFGVLQAYKEIPPSALMKFDITISNSKTSSIYGLSMSDRITDSDLSSDTMENALTVTVDSNRCNPISVNLWFSPFISSADVGNLKVPTTWTLESTSATTIDHETVTDDEGQPSNVFFTDGAGTCYRYSMNISTNDSSGNAVFSVTASTTSGASIDLIFTPTAQSNTRENGVWAGDWTDVSSIPVTQSGVLPGITENMTSTVHAVARFSMTLGSSYSSLKPNIRYTSTVRIIVQGD